MIRINTLWRESWGVMEQPVLKEQAVKVALFQFLFPFSLHTDCHRSLKRQLESDGFEMFDLKNLELETAFYGPDCQVSHLALERYYLPFTNSVIFPHHPSRENFQRYSKRLDMRCRMETAHGVFTVYVHSVDVVLCPFDLGFITVRTELPCEELNYSEALEFVSRFRVLQNVNALDEKTSVLYEGKSYDEVEAFIFKVLVPGMLPFLDQSELEASYFEKLPFFVDERMYVQGLISLADGGELGPEALYRAARIDGMDEEGSPYISASNMEYIKDYVKTHVYARWGPDTYYAVEETSFLCLTRQPKDMTTRLANHMYGEYYYGVLINLFYKIVLLKLSSRYSRVQLDQNQEEVEELIRSITTFSAKYYFLEVVSQSQGKEIFIQLRRHLGSDELFEEVTKTLADLYKYQGNFAARRSNYLLLILTIYTVISGIYGMNQVIDDLKGDIDWSRLRDYSFFEYVALVVTVTGMAVAMALGVMTLFRLVKEMRKDRRQREE